MNVTHLHLLLNHVPTVGMVFCIGLLLLSLIRRNDHVQRASLEAMFIVAVLTLPAYLSGVAARAAVSGRPEVSGPAIDAHHDAAIGAFLLTQLTGFLAWVSLWYQRRGSGPAPRTTIAVLAAAIATLLVTGSAAVIGGEIRHPEIRMDASAVPGPGLISAASIAEFVNNTPWVWPTAETLHFLGMSLLFGILAISNLRILGIMRPVPFFTLQQLLPWSVIAFAVNTLTGMLFVVAAADQYVGNVPFYWKVALLVPAGANLLYLTVADRLSSLDAGTQAPTMDRAIAAGSIGVWVLIMYCGRMLAFLGTSF